jgi:hypothetical protein
MLVLVMRYVVVCRSKSRRKSTADVRKPPPAFSVPERSAHSFVSQPEESTPLDLPRVNRDESNKSEE